MGNLSIRWDAARCRLVFHPPTAYTTKRREQVCETYSRRSSASMSCSWLFLGGLVSTRARLCFTNRRTACDTRILPSRIFQRTANSVLFAGLSPGVHYNVRQGEKLIYQVYKHIRKNRKLWESSILVITYDEHGGLYDHVPPPSCDAPDNKPGDLGFDFKRLGVRVPTVIVSPYINPGTVSHIPFDHTSLISTVRKALTGVWQDDTLGERAGKAKTFDVPEILNRDTPRKDDVYIPVVVPPPPSQDSVGLNELQKFHLKQAIAFNKNLAADKRITDPDPDPNTVSQQEADAFAQKVFATATGVGGGRS